MSGKRPWQAVSEDDDPREQSAYDTDLRAAYEALQPPGEAGVWIVAVAPTGIYGAGENVTWVGSLVGFVILHDRDDNFEYESIAHLWTASGWRRRGVATSLIERARSHFPIRRVEGPLTDGSTALLSAVAPDLV